MHRLVRDLYRRFITVGKDYPAGLDVVRRRLKAEIHKNKDLTDEEDIVKAVARGRWYLKNEVIPVIQLKKYRELKKRYYN